MCYFFLTLICNLIEYSLNIIKLAPILSWGIHIKKSLRQLQIFFLKKELFKIINLAHEWEGRKNISLKSIMTT